MSKFLVSKWNTERKIKFTVQQHNAYIKYLKSSEHCRRLLISFVLTAAAHAPSHWLWQRRPLRVKQAGTSLNPGTFLFGFLLFLIIFFHTFQEVISDLRVYSITSLNMNLSPVCFQCANSRLGSNGDVYGTAIWTISTPRMSTVSPFLWIHLYVNKGTICYFLKGLQNMSREKGASHFPFVFVISVNY